MKNINQTTEVKPLTSHQKWFLETMANDRLQHKRIKNMAYGLIVYQREQGLKDMIRDMKAL